MELLQNYWVSMGLAILATSLFLSILNRFKPMQGVHDFWLVLGMSVVFTVLTTSFEGLNSFSDIQGVAFKGLVTVMVCFLVAISKGQEVVDKLVGFIAGKIGSAFTKE